MLGLMLGGSLALAVPAWNWSDTPVYFHAETQLTLLNGLSFETFNNLDAKANTLSLATEMGCTGTVDAGLRIVTCKLAWLKLTGTAKRRDEQEKLEKILAEWSTQMVNYQMVMEMGMDGKLQQLNLDNAPHDNQRESFVVERQRLLLLRLLCLLDLPLPKDDKGWAMWKEKGWLPEFVLMNTTGTTGAMRLRNQGAAEPRNGYLFVSTEGEATVSAGNDLDAGGTTLLNCTLGGNTLFDPQAGMLAYRDFVMEGQYTASAGVSANIYYQQSATIQRIDALGGAGALPPALKPGPLAAPVAAPPAP